MQKSAFARSWLRLLFGLPCRFNNVVNLIRCSPMINQKFANCEFVRFHDAVQLGRDTQELDIARIAFGQFECAARNATNMSSVVHGIRSHMKWVDKYLQQGLNCAEVTQQRYAPIAAERRKQTTGPLRRQSPARGTTASSDGLGGVMVPQWMALVAVPI